MYLYLQDGKVYVYQQVNYSIPPKEQFQMEHYHFLSVNNAHNSFSNLVVVF